MLYSGMPELYPYQQAALDYGLKTPRWVLADAPGEGKTPTACAWLSELGACRVIIVAPTNDVADHWQDELEVWYPELEWVRYKGSPDKRARLLAEAIDTTSVPVALVMTYSTMRTDCEKLYKLKADAIVFDEAHSLKGRATQQTRNAWKLARRIPNVCMVTGTPVLNRAEEQWSYARALYFKEYTNFWDWAVTHFVVEAKYLHGPTNPPTMMVGDMLEGHDKLLREEMGRFILQREPEPWGEKPLEILLPVELSPAERKAYKHLEKFAWTEWPDGTMTIANGKLAQITKLRQLTADWSALAQVDAGSKVRVAADKIRELVEAGEQVVVFTANKAPGYSLAKLLRKDKIAVEQFNGDFTHEERKRAKERFIEGKAQVLIATIRSMGEGTDGLQHAARYIVMMDRDWTPARNDQCVNRLHRRGQKHRVIVYHVFADETIDESVAEANVRKISIVASTRGVPLSKLLNGTLFDNEIEVEA